MLYASFVPPETAGYGVAMYTSPSSLYMSSTDLRFRGRNVSPGKDPIFVRILVCHVWLQTAALTMTDVAFAMTFAPDEDCSSA
jgi:hypothetical protein